MKETAPRKYILILAGIALGILVGGAALRPKKPVVQQPSPSETASLQRRLRREELRTTAAFYAERVSSVGRQVVYLPERDASGVAWERPGQVLTVPEMRVPGPPLVVVPAGAAQVPPAALSGPSRAGRWLLLVARAPDGQPVWTAALEGGSRPSLCEDAPYKEVIVNTPLSSAFLGAGAYDLDGALAGVVARCGETFHVISSDSILSMLRLFDAPQQKLHAAFGVRAQPLNDEMRALFESESGVVVVELRKDGPAATAGIHAGDVILAIDGEPVAGEADLWNSLQHAQTQNGRVFSVLRNRRKLSIRSPAPGEPAGREVSPLGMSLMPPEPPAVLLSVAPDTAAYRAGLRTGDRVLQVGETRPLTAATVRRLLARTADRPLLVIFERDAVQRAVWVKK
jgi:hypothetical protein